MFSAPELILLSAAIGIVALLYSSVGHGGATGYLAVMALLGISPLLAKPSALWMNCLVAGIAFWRFRSAGYFDARIFLPLAAASVPMAWLGSRVDFHPASASIVLACALVVAGWMLGWGGTRAAARRGGPEPQGARTFLSPSCETPATFSSAKVGALSSGPLTATDVWGGDGSSLAAGHLHTRGRAVPAPIEQARYSEHRCSHEPAGGRSVARGFAILIGAALGFLAGLTGIGGGVFLTPLLIFCRWAPAKVAGGISALFILVNSAAGLFGLGSKAFSLDGSMIWPAMLGVVGALAGSHLGVRRWSAPVFQKALAVVLWIAAAKLFLTHS